MRVTPQGDTCVQSLPSNASAIVVSETMGDATYQVKADEAVLFKGGHLRRGQPVEAELRMSSISSDAGSEGRSAASDRPRAAAQTGAAAMASCAAVRLLRNSTGGGRAFIFRANDPAPDLTENVAILRLENNKVVQLDPTVLPPPTERAEQPRHADSPEATSRTASSARSERFSPASFIRKDAVRLVSLYPTHLSALSY